MEMGDMVKVINRAYHNYDEIGEIVHEYGNDIFLVRFCYNSRIFEDENIVFDIDDLELVP